MRRLTTAKVARVQKVTLNIPLLEEIEAKRLLRGITKEVELLDGSIDDVVDDPSQDSTFVTISIPTYDFPYLRSNLKTLLEMKWGLGEFDWDLELHKEKPSRRRGRTKLAEYSPSYWNNRGKHQELYDELYERLVPDYGDADTDAGELLRSISKIYYDLYNNGWGNGPWEEEWDTVRAYQLEIEGNIDNPSAFQDFDNYFYRTNLGEEIVGKPSPKLSQLLDQVVDGVVLTAAQVDEKEQKMRSSRTAKLRRRGARPPGARPSRYVSFGDLYDKRNDLADRLADLAARVENLDLLSEDYAMDDPPGYHKKWASPFLRGLKKANKAIADIEEAFAQFM